MKEFEDICREYEKDPTEVETDLMSTLKWPEVRIKGNNLTDDCYYFSLVSFLHLHGYFTREQSGYIRTQKGEIAKERGWIYLKIKEYRKLKSKELNSRRFNLALVIIAALGSLIAAIASVFALLR